MTTDLRRALGRWSRWPLGAGISLVVVYLGLSALMDPHGYLGPDTGAKVATLEAMKQNDTADPDVGYWAAELDPTGRLHPLYQAQPTTGGRWIAVTTLPVLELAAPLYDLGGYRAALLLPMLGAVGTSFAARALAQRLGAEDQGWGAFWLVGLASPIVVYALDFWEHAIGVACMLGALVLLLDVFEGKAAWRAVVAGAFLGFAAVLRNESLVYGFVAVGVVCLGIWVRSGRLHRAVAQGGLATLGFAALWLANAGIERVASAPSRAARSSGTVAGVVATEGHAIGFDLPQRVEEGLQTLLGLNSARTGASVLLGAVAVGLVLLALKVEAGGDRRFATVCLLAVASVYLLATVGHLAFVSGLFTAFPMAIAAAVQSNRPQARLASGIAICALPIVYLVQFTGGAAPQWGGRYTLTSAIVLGVVGFVGLSRRSPATARGLLALSLGVTMLGVAFLGVRSRGVDRFFNSVVSQAEPVVISRNAFLIREGGSVSLGRRWLSASDEPGFVAAIDLARKVGESQFSVLEWGSAAPPSSVIPEGVQEVQRVQLTFVRVPVGLVTYRFTNASP